MKLTKNDKELLKKWGFPEGDFRQIEEAFQKTKTTYKLFSEDESVDDKKISREKAIEILGREEYLSGIARSAFHWSAVRYKDESKKVYFDSSKLFK